MEKTRTIPERRIIEIQVNGDPYGGGYVGTEYANKAEYATGIGVHRGDLGAMGREDWRIYCRANLFILRYPE